MAATHIHFDVISLDVVEDSDSTLAVALLIRRPCILLPRMAMELAVYCISGTNPLSFKSLLFFFHVSMVVTVLGFACHY